MAEQTEGEWSWENGDYDADIEVKTISGHTYGTAACCAWECEVRVDGGFDAGRLRGLEVVPDGIDIFSEGGEIVWSAVPEQDRTEVEAALHKATREWLEAFFLHSWTEGQHPFPPKDDEDAA